MITGKYAKSRIDGKLIILTISELYEGSIHTVFRSHQNPNTYFVVWKDKRNLHDFVISNRYSMLAVGLAVNTDSIFRYEVDWSVGKVNAFTITRATSLIEGTEDNPSPRMYVSNNGFPIIE